MFKTIPSFFYGDNTRWFVGEVVEVTGDPIITPLGRVKVRVKGLHEGIDPSYLPWASVVLPTTEGGLTSGFPAALQVGAQVFGIFIDGVQSQLPLVLGSIPYILRADIEANDGYLRQFAADYTGAGLTAPAVDPATLEPLAAPSESAQITYDFFRGINYSDAAARGILGNIIVESANFKPEIVQLTSGGDLDGNSYGICQWRGPRVTGDKGLYSFAKDPVLNPGGLNPGNLMTQLKFVEYELNINPALGKAGLFKCTTPAQAAVHFMRKFEIPADFPGGGTSAYPDPVWDPTGGTVSVKYGESERIRYAEGASYSGTYYT